ncbi:hypothetical protein DXG01_000206 [Tephrocybe rancida]|nr:hypothetical protein DXG01_000206 [Tephrocybe rancida]
MLSSSSDVNVPPPLASISKDDYSAADPARQRIAAKSRRFFSLPNLKASSRSKSPKAAPTANTAQLSTEPTGPTSLITLDSSSLDTIDSFSDKYQWAVVYENQRGMTLFSIPYYSRLGLLPSDPPPFTIPNVSSKSKQTNISLVDYPLPDGTWRWVSKCWMIDMRSDTGEVQHDGFEYNWVFRTHKWSAEVSAFSAGGWVRRRRWIRLMMRPAIPQHSHDQEPGRQSAPITMAGTVWRDASVGSLLPRSTTTPELDPNTAWIENDVEGNWLKCRKIMKHLGRDGRKLELWKAWLAHYHPDLQSKKMDIAKGKARKVQWTEDAAAPDTTHSVYDDTLEKWQIPSREILLSILRTNASLDLKRGNELLQSFVYPDSRASLLAMLAEAGLLQGLDVELGIGSLASGMIQSALRTYALSLSLSLGPALLPFVTALVTAKSSPRTNFKALIRVLRRELGFDGFAFAMTISVGGGAALRELWYTLEDTPQQSVPSQPHRKSVANLSPSQRTFIANLVSSSFGILLLQSGRRRSSLLRQELLPPVVAIPLTPPTPAPRADIRVSDTLDLTLLLLVRAVDSLLQKFIRTNAKRKYDNKSDTTLEADMSEKEGAEEAANLLSSRIDALVFWLCSSRLPRSYVKWIATLANLDRRVIEVLKLIREGGWSYIKGSATHSNTLTGFSQELGHSASWGNPELLPAYGGAVADAAWKVLGVKNRAGVGGLPCELVHGSVGSSLGLEGSCTANSSIRGAMAFLEAIAIYLPLEPAADGPKSWKAATHRPDTLRGLSRWTLSFIFNGPNFWKRKRRDPGTPDALPILPVYNRPDLVATVSLRDTPP